ncbi:TetR family transcriptional regulator [Herbaspirillum lusitanum]|uniref:TetR family transcriptional regulator n=1 Tax=Herbaspirillum lusitanum TaxID=213312 RepID=A0ABW9A4U6_9BURK
MIKMKSIASDNESSAEEKILDAARAHVRRFGEAKTNIVDIARELGTSHTTIYRHFRSKADVFDALVAEAMNDEEVLARTFVEGEQSASERLTGLVLALHRRKLERFENDHELYLLYRRVVDERPEIVRNYAMAITRLLEAILEDGVQQKEFRLNKVQSAAEVVRDAATVFVHPLHVEAAAKAGVSMEPSLHRVMATLISAFKAGVEF